MNKKLAGFIAVNLLLSWSNVDAASNCSYEKQVGYKQSAANVKATYEEAEAEYDNMYTTDENGNYLEKAKYNYFEIKFLNITNDLYIKISNSVNSDIKIITYADTDEGTYKLKWDNLDNVTTFNYSIYSSSNTECPNELLKKGLLTTPRYNYYYNTPVCEGLEENSLCQKYITLNEDLDKVYEKISKNKKEKTNRKKEENQTKKNKKKSYSALIASIVFSLIVCVGGTMLIITRKRNDKNEKKHK